MRIDGIDVPHRFEHARHPLRVEFPGQHRLVPGRRHERHRRQVVDLARPDVAEHPNERELVEQIRRPKSDPVEQVLDAPQVRRARPPDDAEDFVPLVEKQFSQIRAVLPGDASNQCTFSHAWGPQYSLTPVPRAEVRARPAFALRATARQGVRLAW